MGGLYFTLSGVRGVKSRISMVGRQTRANAKVGMDAAMQMLKDQVIQVTPRKTGKLRAGIFVRTEVSLFGVRGIIENVVEYSSWVHEMPEWYNWTTPGTGPKFIEKPLNENREKVFSIVASKMRL